MSKWHVYLALFVGILVFLQLLSFNHQAAKPDTETETADFDKEPELLRPKPRYLLVMNSNCKGSKGTGVLEFAKDNAWTSNENRGFDVVMIDYSKENSCKTLPLPHGDILHWPGAFKFGALHRLFAVERPELVLEYEYFGLLDDDLTWVQGDILKLFQLSDAVNMYLGQPSCSKPSTTAWNVLKHNATVLELGAVGRHIKFIEVMAPVLSRRAMQEFLPMFEGLTHAWGMDVVWSLIVSNRTTAQNNRDGTGDKLVVLDAIIIEHLRYPSNNTALYQSIGGIQNAKIQADQFIQAKTGWKYKEAFGFVFKNTKFGMDSPLVYLPEGDSEKEVEDEDNLREGRGA